MARFAGSQLLLAWLLAEAAASSSADAQVTCSSTGYGGDQTCEATPATSSPGRENVMLQKHRRSVLKGGGSSGDIKEDNWCCDKCSDQPFCSPKSGNCYGSQKKPYYAACAKATPSSSQTPSPATPAPTSCCGNCDREAYCSPNSGNCYWSKNRDYYETCRELPEIEDPITVLSYNVMYTNFPNNLRGVAGNINNNLKPDVMGNQECMNMDAMQKALGTEMLAAPNTDTYNCIFYRPGSGISYGGESDHVYLGDGNRDSYSKRFFSYAKLVKNNVAFWVFSTHWCIHGPCSGNEAGRRHEDSARLMLEKRKELGAEDVPTIIVGDLNSHMNGLDNDKGVQYFLNNGFDLAGKSDLWGGIDYVFVSQGHWKVGATHIGDKGGSDHKPIQVQVDFADDVASAGAASLAAMNTMKTITK